LKITKRRIEIIILTVFTLFFGVLLITFARDVKVAIADSIKLCLYTVIPSLYAFMVLSTLIVSTGIYKVLSRPFSFISRKIFHIPTEFFSIFLLSSIAGYPVGAKLLSKLFEDNKIDSETAASMQCFCYSGGPAFFCGAVSLTLFDSITFGLLIFAVIFFSNIISGIIVGLKKPIPPENKSFLKVEFTTEKFLSAVKDGGISILSMCGIIIFFAGFNAVLQKLGFFTIIAMSLKNITAITVSDAESLLKSTVEINNILSLSSGKLGLLPIITSLLSFGGLCVVVQILQFSSEYIKLSKFLIYRLFGGVVSFFLTKLILILFPALTATFAVSARNAGFTRGTPLPSIFLICMTIILLTFDIHMKKTPHKKV
jgi:hypothetical protein